MLTSHGNSVRPLFLTHSIVGKHLLTNFAFDPDKPYTFCCICGDLYQDATQREVTPESPLEKIAHATLLRKTWASSHAKTHSTREHELLRLSGRAVTPEAAVRLVPFGISPLTDMVSNENNPYGDEYSDAARTAPRQPQDDAQGMPVPTHVGFSGSKNKYPF